MNGMGNEFLKEVIQQIGAAQKEAAQLILQARGVLSQCKSGQRDLVTQYDRQVQALLVARLREFLPQARFFCEENDQQEDLQAEHLFIIDPIDGTMNFVRHMSRSCISVAYASRGQLQAASVYNPYVEEQFTAIRGQGAFCNGRPLHVEDKPLEGTIACCGTSPYQQDLADKTFRLLRKVFDCSLDIRREGSAALDLCSAAAGRAGVYFEYQVSLWDYAAGALLVQEAGGLCCTLEGKPMPLDATKPSIVAGGREAVEQVLALALAGERL